MTELEAILEAENNKLKQALERCLNLCKQQGNPPDPEWARKQVIKTVELTFKKP